MKGSREVLEMEENGYIQWNPKTGEYEQYDEEGLYMYTIDRHDSDAEDFKREPKETLFEALSDAAMSMKEFISVD